MLLLTCIRLSSLLRDMSALQDMLVFWSMLMEDAGMRQDPADALHTLQVTATGQQQTCLPHHSSHTCL